MSKRRSRHTVSDMELFFGAPGASKRGRKDAQLCAQAERALSLALAEERDEALSSLWIAEVLPAPHVGNLQVVVVAPPGAALEPIAEKLRARRGRLRSEVASAIHRKKAPSLSFAVIPAEAMEEDEEEEEGA